MVTCQSSELGWEVTVELPADFLSLGRGSVIYYIAVGYKIYSNSINESVQHIQNKYIYKINHRGLQ